METSQTTTDNKPRLQLAIDVLSISDALKTAELVYPHFDIAEIGTPLIIEEGLAVLEAVKKMFPDKTYLADLKIMDAGHIEASSAFRRGADIVTVLGAADDLTVENAVRAAREHNGQIMADLINVPDCVSRAKQLEALGVDILCLHTAYDRQALGIDVLTDLIAVRPNVQCHLAIAGGLNLETANGAVANGASIVVVGGAIIRATDPNAVASQIYQSMKKANVCHQSN